MVLQFTPFKSVIDPTFWFKLGELKLDVIRLDDAEIQIHGHYTNSNVPTCLMEFDYSAFNK